MLVYVFWNPICLISIIEIHRVREVYTEYSDGVVLREYNFGDKELFEKYQTGSESLP